MFNFTLNEGFFTNSTKPRSSIVNHQKLMPKIGDILYYDKHLCTGNSLMDGFNFRSGRFVGTCCIQADQIQDGIPRFQCCQDGYVWDCCQFGQYTYDDNIQHYEDNNEFYEEYPDDDMDSMPEEFFSIADEAFDADYPHYRELLAQHDKLNTSDIDGNGNTNILYNMSKACADARDASSYLPYGYKINMPWYYLPAIGELNPSIKNCPDMFKQLDTQYHNLASSTLRDDFSIYSIHPDTFEVQTTDKKNEYAIILFFRLPLDIVIRAYNK